MPSTAVNWAALRLGTEFARRYGAPYATVHRADLQDLLLEAAREAGVYLKLSSRVTAVLPSIDAVGLRIGEGHEVEGDALVGADGLWSDGALAGLQRRAAGMDRAPGVSRSRDAARPAGRPCAATDVTVWLGPRLHVVAYPVRARRDC